VARHYFRIISLCRGLDVEVLMSGWQCDSDYHYGRYCHCYSHTNLAFIATDVYWYGYTPL